MYWNIFREFIFFSSKLTNNEVTKVLLMKFQPSLSAPSNHVVCFHCWLLCLTRCFSLLKLPVHSLHEWCNPSQESGLRVVSCVSLSLPSQWQWIYSLLYPVHLHAYMLLPKQFRGFWVTALTVLHICVFFWVKFCGAESSWILQS